jgi:alkaline phosphatase D
MKDYVRVKMDRRDFIKVLGLGAVSGLATKALFADETLGQSGPGPSSRPRRWIGPQYWANRLQDWQWRDGRIESICEKPNQRLRVATRTTEQLINHAGGFRAELEIGFVGDDPGDGFAGLLVGIGGGDVNGVAQGNVFAVGGRGGGTACVVYPDGRLAVLDNTRENQRRPVAIKTSRGHTEAGRGEIATTIYRLQIECVAANDRYALKLSTLHDGQRLGELVVEDLDATQIIGGIGLIADRGDRRPVPTRPWFGELSLAGPMVEHHPERVSGPVVGIQFTLGRHGLKLTAQFMPTGRDADDPQLDLPQARLDFRRKGAPEGWTSGPTVDLGVPSHTACFRLPDWDTAEGHELRVVPIDRTGRPVDGHYHYHGEVPADPQSSARCKVLLFHCPRMVGVSNDQDYTARELEHPFERWTPRNLILPAEGAQQRIENEHAPDLLVFTGDQIYEPIPSRPDMDSNHSPRSDDYLYKWFVFLRTFGHLTRRIPTVTIPDDHDLFLGNIWGWSGRPPRGQRGEKGYKRDHGWPFTTDFYHLVLDTQCSHLPDPIDPQPTEFGLKKYYTRLDYGNTSFAIIEGRTFKTPPYPEFRQDAAAAQMLGDDQVRFIQDWGESLDPQTPRVMISQTVFANPMTERDGSLSKSGFDANGWPKPARDRALIAAKQAGAFLLGGDIHNAVFMKHGVTGAEDGPYQFICCAFGQFFQRWWEPAVPGSDRGPEDLPFTGRFVDGDGNPFRMIACTNAKISFQEASDADFIVGRFIIDPALTRSGYGLLTIDREQRAITVDHWDRDADAKPSPNQYPGWPCRVPIPLPHYSNVKQHRTI